MFHVIKIFLICYINRSQELSIYNVPGTQHQYLNLLEHQYQNLLEEAVMVEMMLKLWRIFFLSFKK